MPEDLDSLAAHLRSIRQIIPLLEAVRSVSEIAFRRSLQRSGPLDDYTMNVKSSFERLVASLERVQRDAVTRLFAQPGPVGLLVIASERGLCGGFNDRIVSSVRQSLLSDGLRDARVLVLGARGRSRLDEAGVPIAYARSVPSLTLPGYRDVEDIVLDMLEMLDRGTLGRIVVLHAAPVGGFRYAIRTQGLYPPDVPLATPRQLRMDVKPAADLPALVRHVLTELLLVNLYGAVFASFVSEQLSRVSSMRLAVENARRLADALSGEYALARRNYITTSLLEIVAGYEAANR
jgi:F-type H+-transporting ATPase subunit gamma